METVVFSPIPGHLGYRAGTDGSIWSCWRFRGAGYAGKCTQVISDRWRRLKGEPRKEDCRLRFFIRRDNGSYRRTYGSILVLEAFVGPCPPDMECCHNDSNCLNNSISNLRWDTHKNNIRDAVIQGRMKCNLPLNRRGAGTGQVRGSKVNTAKLTEESVREIRRFGKPLKRHAKKYGVSEALISAVLKRKVWKHVE